MDATVASWKTKVENALEAKEDSVSNNEE